MNLIERDKNVTWHPYTQMKTSLPPMAIERGDGAYLYDVHGSKYIDAISSWWTNIHGHCHPYIAEKVAEQIKKLDHVLFAGFTHEPAVALAEGLLRHLPNNQKRIFYSDNGSTAVEVALKMAFQYWHNKGQKRTKVIAFENAYHGDTFGAMSVSGRSLFTKPFDDLLFEVIFIPVPNDNKLAFEKLQKVIKSHKEEISAFIFEPLVQGTAGMVMYEAEQLNELLDVCKNENILTIADEVMTGFGRTGKFFACDYLSPELFPDIICLSKGITGGVMALGATSCTNDIYEAFLSNDKTKTLFHGHSYTANPIACAAAVASLDLMEKPETWENIHRIHKRHLEFQSSIKNKKGIKDCRVKGTILAVEIETETAGYLNPLRDRLYQFFIDKKIFLRPLGNIVYVMPPYCISNEDLASIYEVITEAIDSELDN